MLRIELQVQRANLTSRLHAKLMREINRSIAQSHADKRIKQHFDERAYRLYRARKRKDRYNDWKQKKFGHKRPNYRTGALFRNLQKKVTATQYGSRLRMRSRLVKFIPQDEFEKMSPQRRAKLSAKQNRRLAKWQKDEIATVTRVEMREDRLTMARMYKKGAGSPEYKRKIRRKKKG
jgi:hypothetical protein